jgi:hypothetical protein
MQLISAPLCVIFVRVMELCPLHTHIFTIFMTHSTPILPFFYFDSSPQPITYRWRYYYITWSVRSHIYGLVVVWYLSRILSRHSSPVDGACPWSSLIHFSSLTFLPKFSTLPELRSRASFLFPSLSHGSSLPVTDEVSMTCGSVD